MAFLFRPVHFMLPALFSCCGLRHRPPAQPDERTPLIPHADDTPTPQPRVVDHQKLKERLGAVVRAKEGKMVNVNAQFPFNLHDHSSRSSRNVSGGTRTASPSPRRQLHKSRSDTFRPDPEDAPQYLPLLVNATAPVLNVRLVSSARPALGPRGRSQRSDDPNGTSSELAPGQEQTPREQATDLPVDSETPPHCSEDFVIRDAGAVALSWRD